ncbi:hypothetical protein [Actinomadura rugatobispora]|uniref:Uncharacterized protein n=1 Tax=Actinomadura rugatobispora TaxID=1994 RepID=A0ABW0ZXV3_9ACTN|nr:hypothetical protein GCM10010200_040020 [Actinomadura rugatobispora]
MGERTAETDPLAALGAHLGAHGFAVELTVRGLVVRNAGADYTVTCNPRAEDGGRLWFFGSGGEPIAESDHITDARIFVMVRLAGGGER